METFYVVMLIINEPFIIGHWYSEGGHLFTSKVRRVEGIPHFLIPMVSRTNSNRKDDDIQEYGIGTGTLGDI